MQRRAFLSSAAAYPFTPPPDTQFIKSICNVIFPDNMPLNDQFRLARNAGFEGLEIRPGLAFDMNLPIDQARRAADAARKHNIAIASLWVSGELDKNWLNHPDPAVRSKGVDTLHHAIDVAQSINCGALLIVPGRLGNGAKFLYGYQDSWDRITAELRKAVSHAESAKVCLTPENVSNKFLVSPIEMRAFIDQFQSPWLQAHFDIGNVMQFGYPQDWILTLGNRIKRVHVKDYKLATRTERGRAVDLLEGDVDFKDVMATLKKVGYRGFLSPEIGRDANDPDQLMKVSKALDKILSYA
ncbi:MAG: sugar phosphate isomerase/epimerase [Candidatus Solibacter usitatus]|nr:sugar phosphate isomerase/epimerase [Candidatus Solibacter usitatus]